MTRSRRAGRARSAARGALVAALGVASVAGLGFAGAGRAGASGGGVATGRMLRLSDFPKGWTRTGTKVTTDTAQTLIATIGPCLGVTAPSQAGVPSRTRTFNRTNRKTPALTVFEGVARYPTAAAATATWTVLTNTKTPACTAAAFTEHLSSTPTFTKTGLTVTAPVNSALTATPYGPGTASFRFRYSVKGAKGLDFTTRYLYVGVLRGRYLVQLFVSGLNPASSLIRKLVDAASKRVG